MKKKARKTVIPKQTVKPKPAKVGGRSAVSGQVNWSKVGRRRLEQNDVLQKLAHSFKAVREKSGQSVAQIAKELEVAPATLIKFEDKGHPISIKIVLELATHLGCTLEVNEGARPRRRK